MLDVMGAWRRIDGDREHAVFDSAVSSRRGSCQRNEALNRRVWLQPVELEHMSKGQVQTRRISNACFLVSFRLCWFNFRGRFVDPRTRVSGQDFALGHVKAARLERLGS